MDQAFYKSMRSEETVSDYDWDGWDPSLAFGSDSGIRSTSTPSSPKHPKRQASRQQMHQIGEEKEEEDARNGDDLSASTSTDYSCLIPPPPVNKPFKRPSPIPRPLPPPRPRSRSPSPPPVVPIASSRSLRLGDGSDGNDQAVASIEAHRKRARLEPDSAISPALSPVRRSTSISKARPRKSHTSMFIVVL